ncbi:hypothetical protein LguiB_026506 [Lonicera macranthoides]
MSYTHKNIHEMGISSHSSIYFRTSHTNNFLSILLMPLEDNIFPQSILTNQL